MDEELDLSLTYLPCGNHCGKVYQHPGLLSKNEIQKAAISEGWGADKTGTFIICTECLKNESEEKA